MGDQPGDASFGKERRLLNASDYSQVFEGAEARASHRHLLLLGRTNAGPGHRLGLVIAKKNVRLAVQRNRVKRIASEVFRTLPESETSMDAVIGPISAIEASTYSSFSATLRELDQLDNQTLAATLREQWQKLARHISAARDA